MRSRILATIGALAALAGGSLDAVAEPSLKLPVPVASIQALPCASESVSRDGGIEALDRGGERARVVAFCATGTFKRPLYASLAAAGLPVTVRDEVIEAFANTMNLVSDVAEGDGFYVRFEQAVSAGRPVGPGRLLWAEVQSHTKGALAIHRFLSADGGDRFWTASGKPAVAPQLRQPLTNVTVSSGFGMRADPFGEPTSKFLGMGGPGPEETASLDTHEHPTSMPMPATDEPKKDSVVKRKRMSSMSFGGFSNSSSDFANSRRPRDASVDQPLPEPVAPKQDAKAAEPAKPKSALFMHSGVDLVAPTGTPIFAAADGTVVGAHPKGPYGNWIRIDHPGRMTTIYGHLSKYAPEVYPGAQVVEGQLIGYVGNTGRSTGSHLHFEVWRNGMAVDPFKSPEMKPPVLNWADQQRLKTQVAKATAQRGFEVSEIAAE